jgi:hypothetical protein
LSTPKRRAQQFHEKNMIRLDVFAKQIEQQIQYAIRIQVKKSLNKILLNQKGQTNERLDDVENAVNVVGRRLLSTVCVQFRD